MMMLRSILFVIYMYGMMAVVGLACLPLLIFPAKIMLGAIRFYVKCVRFGLRVICGIRTEIRGQQNMPEGAYIVAAKHQCMWDVFIPFLVCDAPTIIMKRELLWYPILGWYALRAGMIPIDRAGTTKTLRQMTRIAKERAANQRQIVIFPEGTRIKPGAPTKYHSAGLASLYKALNVPIMPVATNAGLFWPAKGLRRNKGTIVYEILPPIPTGLARKKMMQQVETEIEAHSAALLPASFLQEKSYAQEGAT
ncbi:MAG: lysophospholipid acyltransferase family protein [Hyphomonas sp.]